MKRVSFPPPECSDARRGAALVEFAVFLPIVALLVFGSIEAANMIYLRQGLKSAAYEVARSVTNVGGIQADAEVRGYEVLAARGITAGEITISPSVNSSTPPGTAIVVTVTAPADLNADAPQWFFEGMTLTASVTMARL